MNALKAPARSAVSRTGPWALSRPDRRLFRRLAEDGEVAGLPAAPAAGDLVQEEDLTGLPEPAQRYMRRAGVLGRKADWSFTLHSRGRFRLRRGWPAMPCEAWQYNSVMAMARVFWMRINAGPISMVGRDSAVGGQIYLVRPGWLGLKTGFSLPVARIDPGRTRSRAARQHRAARVAGYIMNPVTLLMTRKMLLGIKERAEASARSAGHRGKPA